MGTFQKDFLLTLYSHHEIYMDNLQKLLSNDKFTSELSLSESEKLIQYLKLYKNQINDINNTIENILNIKNICSLEEKIEKELMIKILPIINVYRTLLNVKYKNNSNINDQD